MLIKHLDDSGLDSTGGPGRANVARLLLPEQNPSAECAAGLPAQALQLRLDRRGFEGRRG